MTLRDWKWTVVCVLVMSGAAIEVAGRDGHGLFVMAILVAIVWEPDSC